MELAICKCDFFNRSSLQVLNKIPPYIQNFFN